MIRKKSQALYGKEEKRVRTKELEGRENFNLAQGREGGEIVVAIGSG